MYEIFYHLPHWQNSSRFFIVDCLGGAHWSENSMVCLYKTEWNRRVKIHFILLLNRFPKEKLVDNKKILPILFIALCGGSGRKKEESKSKIESRIFVLRNGNLNERWWDGRKERNFFSPLTFLSLHWTIKNVYWLFSGSVQSLESQRISIVVERSKKLLLFSILLDFLLSLFLFSFCLQLAALCQQPKGWYYH